MKRLLRNGIYVFVIAAILIAASQAYEAKESEFSQEGINQLTALSQTTGIEPAERFNNFLKILNETNNKEYRVAGDYLVNESQGWTIVRLRVSVWLDYSPKPGETRGKINHLMGTLLLWSVNIFNPTVIEIARIDFLGPTQNLNNISIVVAEKDGPKNLRKIAEEIDLTRWERFIKSEEWQKPEYVRIKPGTIYFYEEPPKPPAEQSAE